MFIGDLAYALALNLDLEDNPQFYDIPVLETSLVCLTHISAQAHWSLYCKFSQGMSLCVQLMTSLVQASFFFYIRLILGKVCPSMQSDAVARPLGKVRPVL